MPPHPRPALRLCLLIVAVALSPALRIHAQTPTAPAKPPGDYARMVALWADIPAYHDRLTSTSPGPRKRAQLISAFSPASPFPLPEGAVVKVNVALVISDTGKVEAARILDSTDARFNQTSLDAVQQWLFRPALGDDGPRISFTIAPIVFQGAPEPAPRHIKVGFGGWTGNMRYPLALSGRFVISDDGGSPIRAGRVVVSRAVDDTGLVLDPGSPGYFYSDAVGSINADDYVRNPPPQLYVNLSEHAPAATKIATLKGVFELVIPGLDPNATVTVEKASGTFGSPIRSAALRAQGVSIVLFDQPTAERFHKVNAAGGLADYGGYSFDKEITAHFEPNQRMQADSLAVGIDDPNNHLVGVEFQTADGRSLRYDHNGFYHSGGGTSGKRLDIYQLKLPPDARLVCWLITDKSLQKIPFEIHDLELPKR